MPNRAALEALARLLSCPVDEVAFLSHLPESEIKQVSGLLFRHLYQRSSGQAKPLAQLAQSLPPAVVAHIAETEIGPGMSTWVALEVPPDVAASVMENLSISFVAQASSVIDPERAGPYLEAYGQERTALLVDHLRVNRRYDGLARLLTGMPREWAIGHIRALDPDELVGVSLAVRRPSDVEKVAHVLDSGTFDRTLQSAIRQGLCRDLVEVILQMQLSMRVLFAESVARLEPAGREAFMAAIAEVDGWFAFLPVATQLCPEDLSALVNVDVTLDDEVLVAIRSAAGRTRVGDIDLRLETVFDDAHLSAWVALRRESGEGDSYDW